MVANWIAVVFRQPFRCPALWRSLDSASQRAVNVVRAEPSISYPPFPA